MVTSGFIRGADGVKRLSRQRGMTIIGLLMAAVSVGFIAILVMKVVPMYVNDQKVSNIFAAIAEESGGEREIRASIARRMTVNMVNHVELSDFKMESVGRGTRVTLDYEARAHIVGNLYVVAEFKHQAQVSR